MIALLVVSAIVTVVLLFVVFTDFI